MADSVGVNYQWPAHLHTPFKRLAGLVAMTFKGFLFETVRERLDWNPDVRAAVEVLADGDEVGFMREVNEGLAYWVKVRSGGG